MIGMGFVNDWKDMAGLRVVLGILEAGMLLWTRCGRDVVSGEHADACERFLPQLCVLA